MANPKSAKKPKVGMTPTAGSTGDATVMMAATMIPTSAPVIMNDQIRGARRMVTSVFGMLLFSQGGQGHKFSEGSAGSRSPDGPAIDGCVPGLIAYRERDERRGIELDDVRRCPSSVTESLDDLDRPVRRHTYFDRFARCDAREFLQDEPHSDRRRVTIWRSASNVPNRRFATLGIDSGKGHAQHASSGKGRVFT